MIVGDSRRQTPIFSMDPSTITAMTTPPTSPTRRLPLSPRAYGDGGGGGSPRTSYSNDTPRQTASYDSLPSPPPLLFTTGNGNSLSNPTTPITSNTQYSSPQQQQQQQQPPPSVYDPTINLPPQQRSGSYDATTSSSSPILPPLSNSHGVCNLEEFKIVLDYIATKCLDKCRSSDFDDAALDQLRRLPLFQAIQVVHRFNDSVGPRVVNRSAFLIGIVRSTLRWWTVDDSKNWGTTPPGGGGGPNTPLILSLCDKGKLNPDVFTPATCHALQLMRPDDLKQVCAGFNEFSVALHVSNDSYYAKQQLFLSMLHASLLKAMHGSGGGFPLAMAATVTTTANEEQPSAFSPRRSAISPQERLLMRDTAHNMTTSTTSTLTSTAGSGESHVANLEYAALAAAALGKQWAFASALKQKSGMLTEFIARTLVKTGVHESALDTLARDALRRVDLLVAMQSLEHFARSIAANPHVANQSAYVMGILKGQESHWKQHTATMQRDVLHPKLLLKIAHLCLDSNCLPSDFQPDVCNKLAKMDVELAIRGVLAFNINKRVAAGLSHGGVKSRWRFLAKILDLTASQHDTPLLIKHINTKGDKSVKNGKKTGNGAVTPSELNPGAKPFVPPLGKSAVPISAVVVHELIVSNNTISNNHESSSVDTIDSQHPQQQHLDAVSLSTEEEEEDPPHIVSNANTPMGKSIIDGSGNDGGVSLLSSPPPPPPTIPRPPTPPIILNALQYATTPTTAATIEDKPVLSPTTSSSDVVMVTPSPVVVAAAATAADSNLTTPLAIDLDEFRKLQSASITSAKEMRRLQSALESSRDAIDHLHTAFAKSRTSEIRLRKELTEAQGTIHTLMVTLETERESHLKQLLELRQQLLVHVTRHFDAAVMASTTQTAVAAAATVVVEKEL